MKKLMKKTVKNSAILIALIIICSWSNFGNCKSEKTKNPQEKNEMNNNKKEKSEEKKTPKKKKEKKNTKLAEEMQRDNEE